ncbi:MAG: methylated-DNA--[protein]-cysteine S-methyltransferase [Bacteroidales bacterium]|nr:methylated-DNA--[protein]-cysteine S-methyltransferase [Bacteroidales bacterium]
MTNTALYDSPIGPITLTFDGEALTGLRFGKTDDDSVNPPPTKVHRWLDLYFSGRQPDFLPPIKLFGTDFQRRVWQALLEIPYGQTIAYGDLARRTGCRSAQAVGQAVGKNPIAIIVPCHRVIGSDASLTGYAYGIEKKRYLLQLESGHRLTVAG